MSTKHTPGPWSTGGKYAFRSVLLNARGESIASGGNNRAVVGAELEASLQLAAAAPEMLDFLQLLLATDFYIPKSSTLRAPLQALIAKATGGAS